MMSSTASGSQTMSLHALTYVDEPDGVMIGRPETGTYALFPVDGAEAIRRLAAGDSLTDVGAWYAMTYSNPLDLNDLQQTIDALDFVRAPGNPEPATVRWTRLGRSLFSGPA